MMVMEAIMEGLPSLAPIRTAAIQAEAVGGQPEFPTKDEECVTPKSEEHTLKPALVCPPAPKKRRPAKRRLKAPSQGFYAVPCDLTAVFLALPSPFKKRIRVG